MKRLSKHHVAMTTCPQCRGYLRPLPSFQGRPRFYCDECESEILFDWTPEIPYPQDIGLPSRSIQDGSN